MGNPLQGFVDSVSDAAGDGAAAAGQAASDLAGAAAQGAQAAGEAAAAVVEVLTGAGDAAEEGAEDVAATVVAFAERTADRAANIAERGAGVVRDVLKDPVGFERGVVIAVKSGVERFGTNLSGHVGAGIRGWLTGLSESTGIALPDSMSLGDAFGVGARVARKVGGSLDQKIRLVLGDDLVDAGEDVVAEVGVLINEGPSAVWMDVKDLLRERTPTADEVAKAGGQFAEKVAGKVDTLFGGAPGAVVRDIQDRMKGSGGPGENAESKPTEGGVNPPASGGQGCGGRVLLLRTRLVRTERAIKPIRGGSPLAEAAIVSVYCRSLGKAGRLLASRAGVRRVTRSELAMLVNNAHRTVVAAKRTTEKCEALLAAVERWYAGRARSSNNDPNRFRPKGR